MRTGNFATTYRARSPALAYGLDRWVLGFGVIALMLMPLWAGEYWVRIAITAAIAGNGAIGLVLLKGYAGQVSLGPNAFLAIGAYATGVLARDLPGLPFPLIILLSALVAGACGVVAAVPSFRLKGLYLALATFAFQDLTLLFITKAQGLTGGARGLIVNRPSLFGLSMESQVHFFYLALIVLAAATLFTNNLVRGRFGRAWLAVRDRELAAAALGLDVRRHKTLAFVASSFFLGVSGSLYAYHIGFISPGDFGILVGVEYIAMVVVGGINSIAGALIGAAFFTLLPDVISLARPGMEAVLGSQATNVLPFLQQAIYCLVVLLFMLYQHEGLYGWWKSLRRSWDAWPFRS